MYSNSKALALIRDLSDRLTVRLSANATSGTLINTITENFYTQTLSDGNVGIWPYLLCYNATLGTGEGNPVVYIQLSNVDAVSKDIFGNATYAYAPTLCMFAYELTGAAGTNPIPAHPDLATIQFEAQTMGAEWQLIELANGTQVTPANVNAATPIVDIQPLYWPTKSV
jgi:hypothetical protein